MVDDSEYHWRLIADGAEGVGACLHHYPWLAEAIAAQGVTVNLDWDGDTVTRLCSNLIEMRCIMNGDDE